MEQDAPSGYLELIRSNRDFRLLWLGDVISLLGDWFNTIAIYTLIEQLTGSPFALGLVFVIKMGSYALASPLAGVIADRTNRRRLMIGADLLRSVVVLGFLAVDGVDDLPLLYVLMALQIAIGSVFRPARSASLPNVAPGPQLVTANALMAATWSSVLALGAGAGGLVTGWLGVDAVFFIDAATYLVSASLLWRATIPQPSLSEGGPREPLHRVAWRQTVAGWRYLLSHPPVARMALAKSFWGSGGAAMVYMLALLGGELGASSEAVGIGLLFSARGLGTGLGPVVGRALLREQRRWPLAMGACVLVSGLVYSATGWMAWTLWIILPIVVAHALSGANWVFSTVLLQTRAEDAFRGRVFATEWLILTLSNVVTITLASLLLEHKLLTLRQALLSFSAVMVVAGLCWLLIVVPAERRASPQSVHTPRPL